MAGQDTARKSAAIGILVASLIAMAAFAIAPFIQLQAVNQEIEQKTTLSGKLTRLLTAKSEQGDDGKNELSEREGQTVLLQGATTGIAGARLQKWVSNIVSEHDGKAVRYQVLEPEQQGKFTQVGLNTTLKIGIEGLRDIMHAIETGTPILFIDAMTVQPSEREEQEDNPYFTGPLDVTLRVVGFMASSKEE